MPTISSQSEVTAFYLPHDMLDVPAGVQTMNASASGTEVNATNILTRLLIDWPAIGLIPIKYVRLQAIGKNNAAGSVSVRIRDITSGVDVCSASLGGTVTQLVAGDWVPFTLPLVSTTYAVFIYGDGAFDPILYAVTWEWR